ncbi:MAG: hypothetical protein V4700_00590 [Pseudomonadota bacterium]
MTLTLLGHIDLCTLQKIKIARHGEAETLVRRGHPEKMKRFTGLPRATLRARNNEKCFTIA